MEEPKGLKKVNRNEAIRPIIAPFFLLRMKPDKKSIKVKSSILGSVIKRYPTTTERAVKILIKAIRNDLISNRYD
jgi:hypothetical protein